MTRETAKALLADGLKDDKQSPVADYIRRNLDALAKEHPDGVWR